ncbi:hypothetical protein Droror1_Dr00018563 [Drosera rotundifolia]
MPTFTAVALDRLLDQSSSKPTSSVSDPPSPSFNNDDARLTSMRPTASLSRRASTPQPTASSDAAPTPRIDHRSLVPPSTIVRHRLRRRRTKSGYPRPRTRPPELPSTAITLNHHEPPSSGHDPTTSDYPSSKT